MLMVFNLSGSRMDVSMNVVVVRMQFDHSMLR